MPPVKSQPASGENQPAAGSPVFVDASGRRRRWVRGGVGAVIVVLLGYLGIVTMAVAGRPNLVTMLVPGSATAHHDASAPPRALRTPVLHKERIRLDPGGAGSPPAVSDASLSTGDPVVTSASQPPQTTDPTRSQQPVSRIPPPLPTQFSSQAPSAPPPFPSQFPSEAPSQDPTRLPSDDPSQLTSSAAPSDRTHKPKHPRHKHTQRHNGSDDDNQSDEATSFTSRSLEPSAW